MKRIYSILTTLTTSSILLFSYHAKANHFPLTEQFVGYDTGVLGSDSSHGTLNGWNFTSDSITLTNGSGSLDGTSLGLVQSAGDRVFLSAYTNSSLQAARNEFITKGDGVAFTQNMDTNLYYSFLYKFINAADVSADGQAIAQVFRANSGIGTPQHWLLIAKSSGDQIQLGIAKANGDVTNYASTAVSAGELLFLVIRQHILPGAQNDIYDLWINPPSVSFGADEASVPPSDATVGTNATDGTEDTSSTGPGRFAIFAGPSAEFDELRIDNTWAAVTPGVGHCDSAAITQDPTDLTQSAEIAATFYAAASGSSPTLQWQVSTDGGSTFSDIPDATASVYTTPRLSTSDSGNQYRVIANVGCDNSFATSAVASVTVTNPVVTPVGLVMDDTFTDPDLGFDSRNNEPLTSSNSLWYSGNGEDETDPASNGGLFAYNEGGNLVGYPKPGGSVLWLGYFTAPDAPPVHLDVGTAIKVTLPFTPSSFNAFTGNSSLRIGLYDYYDSGNRVTADGSGASGSGGTAAGVRGYLLNLDWGTNFNNDTPLQIMARNAALPDSNLQGSIGDFVSLGSGPTGATLADQPSFQAGAEYTLEFTVARTGQNSVDVTTAISGGSSNWTETVTDTNFVYHRFDAFAIRPNSLETTADMFTFPEFKVEVIPAAISVPPFNITGINLLSPDSITLTWESQSGTTYDILSSDSLTGGWTTNATVVATGASTSYTNSISAGTGQQFYRVAAEQKD